MEFCKFSTPTFKPPAVAAAGEIPEGFIGFLEVFVEQARDINNICIYHKQDVYAKLCLTSDPAAAVSTGIINGGGRNPVFSETLRLDVRTPDCSLKCELWMLSRVKNYLEDQLLGFALVPLSDVLTAAGRELAAEFPLSSTDLFHSPAGFVRLSLSYLGTTPDVVAVAPPMPVPAMAAQDSIPIEYKKVEFPDIKVVKENQLMLSEYFGIPCPSNAEDLDEEAGVRVVESFSAGCRSKETDPASSSISTTVSGPLSSSAGVSTSTKGKNSELMDGEGEADSSEGLAPPEPPAKPLISIDVEPEKTVIQQEIVEMYMKSMQQFTESLAKMKRPIGMDQEISPAAASAASAAASNFESDIDQKNLPAVSKGDGIRKVFYGSRAFF